MGAAILAALALFMFVGFLGSGLSLAAPVTIVTLLLVVGLPAASSAVLLARHFGAGRRLSERRELLGIQVIESEILKLAMASGGQLTAVEVAAHLTLTPEGATDALDRLHCAGRPTIR